VLGAQLIPVGYVPLVDHTALVSLLLALSGLTTVTASLDKSSVPPPLPSTNSL